MTLCSTNPAEATVLHSFLQHPLAASKKVVLMMLLGTNQQKVLTFPEGKGKYFAFGS